MANPRKAKGTRWESRICQYLVSLGISAYRPHQNSPLDLGDIHGISPFIGQAKDWRNTVAALREGVDGATVQHSRAGEDYGVAFIKRSRANVADGYAVMTVRTFALVLARMRRAEDWLAQADKRLSSLHRIENDRQRVFMIKSSRSNDLESTG